MIAKTNITTEGHNRLRMFLVVFRWISVVLGLWLTGFGNKDSLINVLPPFLTSFPFLLTLMLLMYHAIASFVAVRFDDSKINVSLLIIMDIIAGGFMSFYYGLPFFYCAVVLPALITTFYFDILITMIATLFSAGFFIMAIALPLIKIVSADSSKSTTSIFSVLSIFIFSAAAVFVCFRWSMKMEEEVRGIIKKFQDEKNMLFETHQSTKQEFRAVFQEMEKKQELIEELQESLDKTYEEKNEAAKTLENTQKNLENLRKLVVEAEERSEKIAEQMQEIAKKQIVVLQEEYEALIDEKEDIIAEKDRLIDERDDLIREKDLLINTGEQAIEQLEETFEAEQQERDLKIAEIEQQISILSDKKSELESSLHARDILFESYSKINEKVDLETTYMSIVNESLRLVPSQTAIIFTLEYTDECLMLFAEAAATPYRNLFHDFKITYGDGPVGWAAKHRKPIKIDSGEVTLPTGENISTILTYEKSALIIPLVHNDEVVGVIYLGKPEANAYKDKDLSLMSSFAKMAGPTIYTAIEFDKAIRVSLLDEVTGLHNETYFYERCEEEVARSVRYKIPLNLVLIQIENYEIFAESTEKIVQDKLIKDLSEILKSNIRETDIAARLTDNQFAILFIHTDKKDALLVAERIKMSADMRSFGAPQAKTAGLYMAVGMANLPDDAQNRDDLYNIAVKAMVESKKKNIPASSRYVSPVGRPSQAKYVPSDGPKQTGFLADFEDE